MMALTFSATTSAASGNAARTSRSSTPVPRSRPCRPSGAGYRRGPTDTPRTQSLAQLLQSLNRNLLGWATYFRHGAAKRTFDAVDHHAWNRIAIWLRRKHRIPSSQLRNHCDRGWRFASNDTALLGASSAMIERYRYRGARIPTPWTIEPAADQG
ncbi:group II intron maturase-specific domain-containing protein [Streptomyces sp. NPDC059718]